jgi:preprotein translocase subunit SecF
LTNININKKQISILAVVTAMAVVMTVSPVGMIFSNNIAFAGGKDHDNDDDHDGNSASQIIAQVQRSIQNSQVVSGGDTEDSGNNFNFQNQENSGNNALAQSNDDDGDDDGNSASQAIVQSQSSRQNSQVVSGGDTENSGNNFNFQNQENSGNNALAQQ